MPHQRNRHLRDLLNKTLKYSVITGVFGHRQVGKTTLVSSLAKNYVSLDDIQILSESSANPSGFLAKYQASPLVIDECQLSPKLFPALKEWERVYKQPGQFLLTGSVRFSSRKAIRESLTGRLVAWELLPMDWAEIHNQPQSDIVNQILTSKNPDSVSRILKVQNLNHRGYNTYVEFGSLPGMFSVRDAGILVQKFETQINTILERDLRLIVQTTLDFKSLRKLLVAMARQHAKPFEYSEVFKETRISQPTLRKLVAAFESLFLIRFLPTEGEFSKPVLYFEDIGEKNHLLGSLPTNSMNMLSFLYQNMRTQVFYNPQNKIKMFNFRLKNGLSVPLCFQKSERRFGVVPIGSPDEWDFAMQSAQAFVRSGSDSMAFIVSLEGEIKKLGPSIYECPLSCFV